MSESYNPDAILTVDIYADQARAAIRQLQDAILLLTALGDDNEVSLINGAIGSLREGTALRRLSSSSPQ